MNPTLITDLLTYALPSGFRGRNRHLAGQPPQAPQRHAGRHAALDRPVVRKVNDVLQENVTLRREKADWLVAQQELLRKIDKLTREVEGLRKNFNRKTQKKTDETSRRKKRPVLPDRCCS